MSDEDQNEGVTADAFGATCVPESHSDLQRDVNLKCGRPLITSWLVWTEI